MAKTHPADCKPAYRIPEFCAAYGISRTQVYRLWKADMGPRRTYIPSPCGQSRRAVIAHDDAQDWFAGIKAMEVLG